MLKTDFTCISETAGMNYKDAVRLATEKAVEKNLPAARFPHLPAKEDGPTETKIVNLNVCKEIRSDNKQIHGIAVPGIRNVFVMARS